MSRTIPFDRVVDIYDSTRALPPAVMSRVVKELTDAMEVHGCRRILDAGVGTGRFAGPLQEAGFDVAGIDISSEMLGKARTKSVKNLFRGDIRRMPFRDKSFDGATAVHILHLIKEWRDALREIKRVVRVGLFSMVTLTHPTDSPRESYKKMLMDTGWPELHQGIHERDLINVIPPTESESVMTYSVEAGADEEIDSLERCTYSFQWEIPEETHRHIVARLRKDWSGRRFASTRELRVCMWDVGLF